MRLLFGRLRRHGRLIALALGCALCNQVLSLLDPYLLRCIIDSYATQQDRYTLAQFLGHSGLLLALGLAAAALAWMAKTYQVNAVGRLSRGIGIGLYSDALRHSLAMPYAVFEEKQSGQLVATIQTARHHAEALVAALVNTAFTALVGVVFVVWYAAQLHWVLAPVLLLMTLGLGAANLALGARLREIQRQIVEETSRLAGSATESLRNLELLRSLGLSRQTTSRLEVQSDRILAMEMEKIRHARNLTFFHGACVNLSRAGILLLFLYLLFARQISIGQFFSLFFYSYFIFSPVQELGTLATCYHEASASLQQIAALLESSQEQWSGNYRETGPLSRLAFRGVSFQYPSCEKPAVLDISFEASRGETVALVGASGSGKTTIVKLLAGLHVPQAGEITINNISLSEIGMEQVRARIGLVTQDTQLFSGSIRDNLLSAKPEASDAECLRALERASATRILKRTQHGLDTPLGEGGLKLSGGEKQRVAIARALLRKPDLLIFDEATSSLDSLTEAEVARTIDAVHRDGETMVLIISHRLSIVRRATRIHVFDHGRICESGSHEELLDRKGLYTELWRRQAGETEEDLRAQA